MTTLVKVKLNDTEIWIEMGAAQGDQGPRRAGVEKAAAQTLEATASLHATIQAYCTSLVQTFDAMPAEVKPQKITAEFGLSLSGDAKFYVVNVAGNASLKICSQWELK